MKKMFAIVAVLFGAIAVSTERGGLLIIAFSSFFLWWIWSEPETKSSLENKISRKIKSLNSGILNSNSIPEHYTFEQCNDMAMQCVILGAIERDFEKMEKSKSSMKKTLKELSNIEKEAIQSK